MTCSALRLLSVPSRSSWLLLRNSSASLFHGNFYSTKSSETYDVVVVGAGISGLSTAQALSVQHNIQNILVTEADNRVGGKITTLKNKDYLWEEGPNSCLINDALRQSARDAGVENRILTADPSLPRWVLWGGRLRPAPVGRYALKSDLLSTMGILRALRGLTGIGIAPPSPKQTPSPSSSSPSSSSPSSSSSASASTAVVAEEESVERFVRRTLGDEVFERLVEPFCSGVYAGDPKKLSMRAAFGKLVEFEEKGDGSIVRGVLRAVSEKRRARKAKATDASKGEGPAADPQADGSTKKTGPTVSSFEGGIETLPLAIARGLGDRVRLGMRLVRISPTSSADAPLYTLTYKKSTQPSSLQPSGSTGSGSDGGEEEVEVLARHVVMTTPAFDAAEIFRTSGLPSAAEPLEAVDYPPVALVVLSYDVGALAPAHRVADEPHGLKGFGQLHPRPEGLRTLGTIYGSTLFAGRAPADRTTLLSFVGGATDRGVATAEPAALAAEVDADLRRSGLINTDALKPHVLGVRVWHRAIPQFDIGHLDRVDAAKAALLTTPAPTESSQGGQTRDEKALKGAWRGVHLAGNYVSGVAVGRCVEFGFETAEEIAQQLAKASI